jgi:hypothetical protein
LSLDIEIKNTNSATANEEAWNLVHLNEFKNPLNLFTSNDELNELIAVLSKLKIVIKIVYYYY